jgi:predicted nuclease of predicted toxin-antitoxin system
MKFLVDEQLPPLLVDWLLERQYDTIYATALAAGKRITDHDICQCSIDEQRVVITKDEDFLTTYLMKKQPYKLIYLTVDNIKNRQLLDRFRANFDSWEFQLEAGANVLEVNQYDTKVRD